VGYLTAHGLLHLLGYDHETDQEKQEMRVLEERIMAELNLTRVIRVRGFETKKDRCQL